MGIQKIKTCCGNCDTETNHNILHQKSIETDDSGFLHYLTVECLGCDNISFVLIENSITSLPNSDDWHQNFPECESTLDEGIFLIDDEFYEIPRFISDVYEEMRLAYKSESQILCGIGLRTIVEAICIDKLINGADLKRKIENLKTLGHISINEHPVLDKIRQIGNLSAHSIKRIPIGKLEHAIQIVNHLIRSIYILPKVDKRLKI